MEMIFDIINKVVDFIPMVVQRILIAIIPQPYIYAVNSWLHIALAYLIGRIVVSILLKGENIKIENANNKGIRYPYNYNHIYKSLSRAKNILMSLKVLSWYMMLLNLRLITITLASASTDWIVSNILWLVIGFGAVAVMMLCLTGREEIGNIWLHDSSKVWTLFGICGAVMLGCRMFFGMFGYVGFTTILATVLFSRLTVGMRKGYGLEAKNTINYFATKDKQDTFVEGKVDPDIVKEIDRHIESLGNVSEPIGNVRDGFNVIRTPEFFIETPVGNYTNEEYYNNMKTARQTGLTYSLKDNKEWNEFVSANTAEIIKRADTDGYSADQYEEEGIRKVFDALGYDKAPTRENYIKFRKSAEFLAYICSGKIMKQRYQWRTAFDERFPVIESGVIGEAKVAEALDRYASRRDDVYVFPGYYMRDLHTECDFVVVSTKGVFCIEVKTYGMGADYSLEIKENGEWYKRYGSELHRIEGDPFGQNEFHIQALTKKFGAELAGLTSDGSVAEIRNIMVLASGIGFINESPYKILSVNELADALDKRVDVFDADKVKTFADALAKANDAPLRSDKEDFVGWKNKIESLASKTDAISKLLRQLPITEKYRIMDK